MKKDVRSLIIALLIGITIVSCLCYVFALKAKQILQKNLKEITEAVVSLDKQNIVLQGQLQKEKQIQEKLKQDKDTIEVNLKEVQNRLDEVNAQLAQANNKIVELNTNIDSLSNENLSLQQEKANLQVQVRAFEDQKEQLEARLNSIDELKKTMIRVKHQILTNKIELKNKLDAEKISEGNKGFLVREGKSTFKPKLNIEVVPVY